jgi:hypothetical protein
MNTSPIKNCRILEYLISGCRRKCSLVASDKGIELFGHVRGPSFDLSDLIGYDHLGSDRMRCLWFDCWLVTTFTTH